MKVTIPIYLDSFNIDKTKELTVSKVGNKATLSTGGYNEVIVNANQLRKALAVLKEDA